MSDTTSSGLRYYAYVSGGTDGETYSVYHEVTLSVGSEVREAEVIIPVAE